MENYKIILQAWPHYAKLRTLFGVYLKYFCEDTAPLVLEIGSGFGESTDYCFELNPKKITLIDQDRNSIKFLQRKYAKNTNIEFVIGDANNILLEYVARGNKEYSIITASWTLHNFPEKTRASFFKTAHSLLKENGLVVILDKYYPDDVFERKKLFNEQLSRINKLPLSKNDLQTVIDHEYEDVKPPYLMTKYLAYSVEKLGFELLLFNRSKQDALVVYKKLL